MIVKSVCSLAKYALLFLISSCLFSQYAFGSLFFNYLMVDHRNKLNNSAQLEEVVYSKNKYGHDFITKSAGKYTAQALDQLKTIGLEIRECEFHYAHFIFKPEKDILKSCLTEKLAHDLDFKETGFLRVLLLAPQNGSTWATIHWNHAKFSKKEHAISIWDELKKTRVRNFKAVFSRLLDHDIEIIFDKPLSFSVPQLNIPFIRSLEKIEIESRYKEDRDENKYTDVNVYLLDRTGSSYFGLKSNFTVKTLLKNIASKKISRIKHKQLKFFTFFERIEGEEEIR